MLENLEQIGVFNTIYDWSSGNSSKIRSSTYRKVVAKVVDWGGKCAALKWKLLAEKVNDQNKQ